METKNNNFVCSVQEMRNETDKLMNSNFRAPRNYNE